MPSVTIVCYADGVRVVMSNGHGHSNVYVPTAFVPLVHAALGKHLAYEPARVPVEEDRLHGFCCLLARELGLQSIEPVKILEAVRCLRTGQEQ